MLLFPFIYPFFEQVWQPLCELLAKRENRGHWIKLFIIDNEVEDEDGKDYYVNTIEESIQSSLPFKLDRAIIEPKDLQAWIEDGRITPKKVFYDYDDECEAFLRRFTCDDHYVGYLPKCKTVEKLFDKICTDIPDDLIKGDLKKLINDYANR